MLGLRPVPSTARRAGAVPTFGCRSPVASSGSRRDQVRGAGARTEILLVWPGRVAFLPRCQEQDGELEEQELAMDEGIDRPLPPTRLPAPIGAQPRVIGRPVARLVMLDDPEDFHQPGVGPDDGVA